VTDSIEGDWQEAFRYGPSSDDVDCYYIFAPVGVGAIELFQLDVMLAYGQVLRGGITVVTADGTAHRLERTSNEDTTIVRDPDQFRLAIEGLFTLTSGAPGRFRLEATSIDDAMQVDVEVRPATKHTWPTVGYDYFTTLDSSVQGSITIEGARTPFQARGAFEHATYDAAANGPKVQLPPFWHYEYIAWDEGVSPFGSILWHLLDETGHQIDQTSLATSGPRGAGGTFETFDLIYGDVRRVDGILLPQSWDVRATKDAEEFSYRSRVRHVASSSTRGDGFLVSFVLDCEGEHRGPSGIRRFSGVGRSEYIKWTLNPVELEP